MAEPKPFKVVAAHSVKRGTKHRVQLEIRKRAMRRVTEIVEGKPVTSRKMVYVPVYIKNVELADVLPATITTASKALITEYKARPTQTKKSAGFAEYEEEFNR